MAKLTDDKVLADKLGIEPWDDPALAPDPLADAINQGAEEIRRDEREPRNPYTGFSYSELKRRPPVKTILRTPTCIIPYGFTEVFGKPGTGKSTYTIELTVCAAAGATFHGAKLDIGRRHLYFAAEGGGGIPSRIAAVLQRNKITEADIDGNWLMVEKPLDLNDPKTILAAIKANPGRWDTITIDTLAQSMSGDENSTKDMNAVVANLKPWRDAFPALFLLHHEGRAADHSRGSIALDAATDCQLRVAIDADGRTNVILKRLRDFGLPDNRVTRFKLNRKTGLLDPDTGFADREGQMLALLVTLCVDEPDGVAPTEWRAACEVTGLLDAPTDDGKDIQWQRAIARLRTAKAIKITGRTSAQRVKPLPLKDFAADIGD